MQTSLRCSGTPRPRGQAWSTFLRNQAETIWACDFLPVIDLAFRPLFAFFVIALGTRQVVQVGVTRHPTDARVARQRREATPFDRRPRYRVRDNDGTCGAAFARVAAASGMVILRTPDCAPRANAPGARSRGSVRRACPDQVPVLGARHRARVLREDVAYCNRARPEPSPRALTRRLGPLRAVPTRGGLPHTYQRAA